jgi:diguanylate cyclase (GGDEF)-like protein/putative nucleotidyltransferase with HDIG domain
MPALAYALAIAALAVFMVLASLPLVRVAQPVLLVTLLVLSSAMAAMQIELPLTSRSSLSVSYVVDFLTLMLVGPYAALVVAAGSALTACYFQSAAYTPPHRGLFSTSVPILAIGGAGLAFDLLGGGAATRVSTLVPPIAAAVATYFVIDTALVAIVIGLSSNVSITRMWRVHFLPGAPSCIAGACIAGLTKVVVSLGGYWMAPLTFAPIYLMYRTYKVYRGRIEDERRHVQETSDLHLATIEALARAIDAKDQTTQPHIRRVQIFAARLAEAAGLSPEEVQGVKTAALLHDIGKLAVPEHILSKPGPLTQEEFQKIRVHPLVGAEIIAAVPFPYPVAPLILSHHERWDGKGYPQGLARDHIPMGARILTVVDYYDAVTTERPYHRPLPQETAIAMLKHESGRALDPQLVTTFIDLLPTLTTEFEHSEPAKLIGGQIVDQAAAPRKSGNAFENIALAHREIYALYEIAQAMGTSLGVSDTMALISSKISNLVPWSGCALFLFEAETERLRCRFAAGADAPRLLNATLGMGEGLSGRVARSRRPLVNADPRVSFAAAGILDATVLRAALVCPLYHDDEFLGCLALYHTTPDYYTEDHRRVLERVAEQTGTVLHNSIVFEQTQEDSLTDPLTGLPNRRSMFAHLSRELTRAGRVNTELALIVMDLDGFKGINDTYGHHVGDAALRAVAAALQRSLRPYDLCVRYAGDEFIVVLTDSSRESAEAKRRELQTELGAIELAVRPGRTVRLAASAGVSVFPHDGQTYEALLAEADQRMYHDKAERRGESTAAHRGAGDGFLPGRLIDITVAHDLSETREPIRTAG